MSHIDPDIESLIRRVQSGESSEVSAELPGLLDTDLTVQRRIVLQVVQCLAEYWSGRTTEARIAATVAIALAMESAETSWQALAIGWRAVAQIKLGNTVGALEDLLDAELLVSDCPPDPVLVGAYNAMAVAYKELGLYQLAVPCRQAAAAIPGQPFSVGNSKLVDHFNLAVIEWGWATELERQGIEESDLYAEYVSHLDAALSSLDRAAEITPNEFWKSRIRTVRISVSASLDAELGLPALMAEYERDTDLLPNDRALLCARISQALRRTDQTPLALEWGNRANEMLTSAEIFPSTAEEVLFQLHMAHLANSDPGSVAVDGYVRSCTRALWKQRLNTVDSFRARLDSALRQRDNERNARLTWMDPLTDVGNRRALTKWLSENSSGPAAVMIIDIDNFRGINERHGPEVGDTVLRRLAAALHSAIRGEDIVCRYGSDSFVVAAVCQQDDADSLHSRVNASVGTVLMSDVSPGLVVRVSIGMAAADSSADSVRELLQVADRRMRADKATHHRRGQTK